MALKHPANFELLWCNTRYLTGNEGLWEDQSMNMEDLQETAELAHLTMDEQDLAAAFPAFEQMLGFFAAMQAADEDLGSFPSCPSQLSGPSRIVTQDHFRQDTSIPPSQQHTSLVSKLLDNAGDRDGRFVLVPNVL